MHNLDLLNSILIGGVVLLASMGLFLYFSNYSQTTVSYELTQKNITEVGEVLDHDINKLGYRVTGSPKIVSIDSTHITFLSDLNNDGTVDSVKYFQRYTAEDTNVVRRVSFGAQKEWQMGIKKFYVAGLDSINNITYDKDDIRSLFVKLYLTSSSVSGEKVGSFWEKRFILRNL